MSNGPRWRNTKGEVVTQRFDPFDVLVVALGAATDVSRAVTHGLGGLTALARNHANHRADRREFAADVGATIERLG